MAVPSPPFSTLPKPCPLRLFQSSQTSSGGTRRLSEETKQTHIWKTYIYEKINMIIILAHPNVQNKYFISQAILVQAIFGPRHFLPCVDSRGDMFKVYVLSWAPLSILFYKMAGGGGVSEPGDLGISFWWHGLCGWSRSFKAMCSWTRPLLAHVGTCGR